jgi:hypothetical protein
MLVSGQTRQIIADSTNKREGQRATTVDTSCVNTSTNSVDWAPDPPITEIFRKYWNCYTPTPQACMGTLVNNPINTVLPPEKVSWSFSSNTSDVTIGRAQGRPVTCTYKLSNILGGTVPRTDNIISNLRAWVRYFGANDTYNDIIMPEFCAQSADPNTCRAFPPYAYQQETPACPKGLTNTCARINSSGEDGTMCRSWASSMIDQGRYRESIDEIISRHCVSAKGDRCSIDCMCANRGIVDPIYQKFSPSLPEQQLGSSKPMKDACWYAPCKVDSGILVPKNQVIDPGDCPQYVCQQVIAIFDNQSSNINVGIANMQITCTKEQTSPPPAPPASSSIIPANWMTYWPVILFIVVVVIVIIIAFIIIISKVRS